MYDFTHKLSSSFYSKCKYLLYIKKQFLNPPYDIYYPAAKDNNS